MQIRPLAAPQRLECLPNQLTQLTPTCVEAPVHTLIALEFSSVYHSPTLCSPTRLRARHDAPEAKSLLCPPSLAEAIKHGRARLCSTVADAPGAEVAALVNSGQRQKVLLHFSGASNSRGRRPLDLGRCQSLHHSECGSVSSRLRTAYIGTHISIPRRRGQPMCRGGHEPAYRSWSGGPAAEVPHASRRESTNHSD